MTQPSLDTPFPEDKEATPQANQSLNHSETDVNKPQTTKRSPWLFSGLILGFMLGSVATFAILPYLPLSIVNQLHLPTLTVLQPDVAHIAPPPAITDSMQQEAQREESKTSDVVPTMDTQTMQSLQASMEQLQQRLNRFPDLKESMANLSKDLQTMHAQQSDIRAAQISVETMQLHSRLSWILHPSSHLPQIRLAWEEIVLLPSLSPEKRQQSSDMLALAQQRSEDVYHWQQELDRVLASYHVTSVSAHNKIADWLPMDGALAPISTWLVQHFQLRPSRHQDETTQALRQQIRTIQQNMSLEIWPENHMWKSLRSRLQLHMLHDDPQHQALNLPEDFSGIQGDMERLRQTARNWLQESSK